MVQLCLKHKNVRNIGFRELESPLKPPISRHHEGHVELHQKLLLLPADSYKISCQLVQDSVDSSHNNTQSDEILNISESKRIDENHIYYPEISLQCGSC